MAISVGRLRGRHTKCQAAHRVYYYAHWADIRAKKRQRDCLKRQRRFVPSSWWTRCHPRNRLTNDDARTFAGGNFH